MKKKLLAVRDIGANYYMDPFIALHVGTAIREFSDLCSGTTDAKHPFALHPESYELWEIGEFETDHGTITSDPDYQRKQLAAGANFLKN